MDPTRSDKGREALRLATTEQTLNIEAALRDKMREVVDSTRDQIQTQQMLNAAIGKGWEAQNFCDARGHSGSGFSSRGVSGQKTIHWGLKEHSMSSSFFRRTKLSTPLRHLSFVVVSKRDTPRRGNPAPLFATPIRSVEDAWFPSA